MITMLATPRRWLASLGAAILAIFAVALALPSGLPQARAIAAQDLAWSLPTLASVEADAALSVIQQRRLWSASAVPGGAGVQPPAVEEKPLTPPDWRIAGVVTEGQQLVLLIATQGEFQPKTLRVGDPLPGGARVVAIYPDRVVAKLDGRNVSLSTFPQ